MQRRQWLIGVVLEFIKENLKKKDTRNSHVQKKKDETLMVRWTLLRSLILAHLSINITRRKSLIRKSLGILLYIKTVNQSIMVP
jgi:hypothetical protein